MLLFFGRILFAAAILAFGVLCLVYVEFVHSLQPVPEAMPGYSILALLTGLVLLVAGMAIMVNVQTLPAAIALTILFTLWIVLLHIPSAFLNPGLLRSPWWIRTFETLAFAGVTLILAGLASRPRRARWIRAGRALFGLALPVFGVLHFIYPASVAALVALSPVTYPWPMFWALLTGAGHFAAGVAIVTGVLARPAAVLAGLMYASWALTLHLPRVIVHPDSYSGHRPELTSLFVCVAFWGAAWIVAGSLTHGTRNVTGPEGDHPSSRQHGHRPRTFRKKS